MRGDQYENLRKLGEKLAEVVLRDADPENWVASEKMPCDLTKDERADAYWCRKFAMASLAALARVSSLSAALSARESRKKSLDPGVIDADDAEAIDAEVEAAENEAERLLEALNEGGGRGARSAKFGRARREPSSSPFHAIAMARVEG
ncbi:MAG: hypothetical protein LBL72_08935 [Candidatus Accumulibacter sp.]|jgi:hypothetical protein|nr:hypothetical protein [Accumulibacter sp.]